MSTEPFEFAVQPGETLTLEEAVGQAIGAASVCWDDMSGTGEFDSSRASEICDKLLLHIREAK